MGNFTIHAGLADGGLMPIAGEDKSSADLVVAFTGDDTGAPPRSLTITVRTESGKNVEIVFPNSRTDAVVKIDGKMI